MKYLQRSIKAVISEGEESGYVGSCFNLPIVTQGVTFDEVVRNLKEAIELHFGDEDAEKMGYINNPIVIIMYEMVPAYSRR